MSFWQCWISLYSIANEAERVYMKGHLLFGHGQKALASIIRVLYHRVKEPELENETGDEIDALCIPGYHSGARKAFHALNVLFLQFQGIAGTKDNGPPFKDALVIAGKIQ